MLYDKQWAHVSRVEKLNIHDLEHGMISDKRNAARSVAIAGATSIWVRKTWFLTMFFLNSPEPMCEGSYGDALVNA